MASWDKSHIEDALQRAADGAEVKLLCDDQLIAGNLRWAILRRRRALNLTTKVTVSIQETSVVLRPSPNQFKEIAND